MPHPTTRRPNPHGLRIIGGYMAAVSIEYERARRALQDAFTEAIRARGVPQGPEVDAARARLDRAAEALRPPEPLARTTARPLPALPGILASDLKKQRQQRIAAEEEAATIAAMRQKIAQSRVLAARRRTGASSSSSSSSTPPTPPKGA